MNSSHYDSKKLTITKKGMVFARLDPPSLIVSLVNAWYPHLKSKHGFRFWKDAQLQGMIIDLVRVVLTRALIFKFFMQCLRVVCKKYFELPICNYLVWHYLSMLVQFRLLPPNAQFHLLPLLVAMASRRRRPRCLAATHSRVVRAVKATTNFYSTSLPVDAQTAMDALEGEACLVCDFKEADEVEDEVGAIIPNVDYTRSRNSIFFRTVELYWHTKTLVDLGLLSKDEYFRQLKSIMETLEIQNAYIYEILIWMANRMAGAFSPDRHYSGPKSSNVISQRTPFASAYP